MRKTVIALSLIAGMAVAGPLKTLQIVIPKNQVDQSVRAGLGTIVCEMRDQSTTARNIQRNGSGDNQTSFMAIQNTNAVLCVWRYTSEQLFLRRRCGITQAQRQDWKSDLQALAPSAKVSWNTTPNDSMIGWGVTNRPTGEDR